MLLHRGVIGRACRALGAYSRENGRHKALVIMFSTLVLLAAQSTSAAVPLSCPSHNQTQQSLASPVNEWHSSTNKFTIVDNKLRGVFYGFTFGPPEGMALLKPNSVVENKKGLLSTWLLEKSEQVWLVCGYDQTTIQLSKPLPTGLKKCFVQIDRKDNNGVAWCK